MEIFSSPREFSRGAQPERRQQVAETIRSRRKEYFDGKKILEQQLQELLRDVEAKKFQAAAVRTMIEVAEADLVKKDSNFVRRLLERTKIKHLEAKLGTARVSEEILIAELEALEFAQWERQQSLHDRTALEATRAQLDLFYEETEKNWENYKDDRAAGDIKNIALERGAFIAHAFINPAFSPSDENGMIRRELSWSQKLDLLTLEPTLSASAVDKNHQTTFAPVGVLLGGGQVLTASAHDIGSRTVDQETRTFGGRKTIRIRDQIDEALRPDNVHGWTEFIVSQPKVAGLFFRLRADNTVGDLRFGSDAAIPDVVQAAQERNLPLFVLQQGEFYSITPEEALALTPRQTEVYEDYPRTTRFEFPKLELKEEKRLTPPTMVELTTEIDEQQREAILERFMTDSPFNIWRFPEALQVAARAEGRSVYNLYQEADTKKSAEKKKATIPAESLQYPNPPLEVTILKTVPGPTHLEHYVILEDGRRAVWRENRNPMSAETRRGGWARSNSYIQDWLIEKESEGSVGLGLIRIRIESHNFTISGIIEATKKEIEKAAGWIKEHEAKGRNADADQVRNFVKRMAASLYGIAEEAHNSGDTVIAAMAQSIAAEVFPMEEYHEMLSRRVSESGTFKITREELLGQ